MKGQVLASALLTATAVAAATDIRVDLGPAKAETAPDLWGIFFEDIDLSIDGGIYAEMVRNRSFEEDLGRNWYNSMKYWQRLGSALVVMGKEGALSKDNPTYLGVEGGPGAGVANEGFFGMGVRKGMTYELSVALRGKPRGDLEVTLEAYNKPVLAKGVIRGVTDRWKTYRLTLRAKESDPAARLAIRMTKGGSFDIDCVSLMPGDAVGGLFRRDVMKRLAALRPSFVRFPGGCWVEGNNMKEAYRWKETLGSVWERRPKWNIWGYWASNGIGFHEYLLLCEALRAKPLYCINVGMSHSENVPMDKMDEFVQDALDCIEYANGPVDSTWGAKRAAAGHPKPFNLEYLEIGNENGGREYEERYALIAKAVRAKYPGVKLIFDNWKDTRRVEDPKDLRDDHCYVTPDRFMGPLAHEYDHFKEDFKIFVGEYAVTKDVGRYGSLRAAIGEAAYMLGLERNPQAVRLAAFAPLIANVDHSNWTPNMIYPTASACIVSPSWNVQRIFSANRGKELLNTEVTTGKFHTRSVLAWGNGWEEQDIEKVQATAVRTEKGEIVVKLVNCTEEPQDFTLNLRGRASRLTFTGPDRNAHNTLETPDALKEVEDTVDFKGTGSLPPLSLVVYRFARQQN